MVPVAGVAPDRVRDTFNEARDNGGRIHRATDILASRGTPVVAVSSGTVLRMSQNTRGGITLYMLDTRKRFLFYYAHLDRYSDYVSPNARVAQGTILGYVGSSGNADPGAPHLHFQAMRWDPERRDYWNGAPVDVRPFFQLIGQEREN
jgi:murein DD-endopeptidase MepM/ murein hydrolase activator NlpD